MSRHRAAVHFGVAISTAVACVRRFRETGSAAPGQMGGHEPKAIRGSHRDWLIGWCKDQDFTLRGLVGEMAERGLKVDYRSVWELSTLEAELQKNRPRQRSINRVQLDRVRPSPAAWVLRISRRILHLPE